MYIILLLHPVYNIYDIHNTAFTERYTQRSGQELKVTIRDNLPSSPCSVLGLFLFETFFCDLATPQHPSSLVPSPLGINRKVFIPLENFSFNLSFLCSSVGAKSYPLRESSCRGACVALWWMIYWCLSGMNRSKAVAWQAINQASNQGWQSLSGTQAQNTPLSFFFLTGTNTSNTLACKNEIRWALFGELGCWQPGGSALKRWKWSAFISQEAQLAPRHGKP